MSIRVGQDGNIFEGPLFNVNVTCMALQEIEDDEIRLGLVTVLDSDSLPINLIDDETD